MAKKNSSFGKFIAFTTAVAAIGGACYIFRDQIKESEAFKKTTDKLSALRNKVSNKFSSDEDDFFFDDEFEDDFEDDIFDEDAKSNREYTSITINSKDNATSGSVDAVQDAVDDVKDVAKNIVESATEEAEDLSDAAKDVANDVANAVKEKTEAAKDEVKEIFADDSIPTISFGNNNTESTDETAATEEVLGYENEGLSDVYEDPDVLGDQDKLDF